MQPVMAPCNALQTTKITINNPAYCDSVVSSGLTHYAYPIGKYLLTNAIHCKTTMMIRCLKLPFAKNSSGKHRYIKTKG
jgi:hypothetical protein